MRRITSILTLLICLGLLPVAPVMAGLFSNDTLVSIDENNYSMDDFKHWWKFWKEEEEKLPETPDPYINWLLISREAERMGMAESPSFKRQTRVFLQSRTLLMLKFDEVDSKIDVTDALIKERYEELFLPRWQIQRLEFKNEGLAIAAWEKLANGSLTLDDLIERDPEQDGPIDVIENWVRPKQIDDGWISIFKKLTAGEVVDPNEHGKGRTLYALKEQKGGDEEDLAKFSDGIQKNLWKEQEDRLSFELLKALREKYEVQVDKERIAALDINASDDSFTDAAVITSNRENVSEKQFMAVIRRLLKSRPVLSHETQNEEDSENLKNETVTNIISQSVTNWGALDQHYEEKEPFKWSYEFNFKHRLKQALERQIFGPAAEISEEEIKRHYEDNLSRYTQPRMVNLYIIDETQVPIDLIWTDVAVGKDFEQVLKEHSEQPIQPREVPENHLDPEVKEVVAKLIEDETSQIFTAQGIRVLVHLLERTPEAPLPLERVKESIRSFLWREKLNQARNTYIDKIKAASKIEVREQNWRKIQKELGGV